MKSTKEVAETIKQTRNKCNKIEIDMLSDKNLNPEKVFKVLKSALENVDKHDRSIPPITDPSNGDVITGSKC